jgi:hypothetical protein
MKQNIQALINIDRGGWCIKDLMDITSLAEDKAIIALFSGENKLPGHKMSTTRNVTGRFRRVFQNNANGQYGVGSFYGHFGQYNDCIKKGDNKVAKKYAYSTLEAFISGVLMLISRASIAVLNNGSTEVWKDRIRLVRDAYDKIKKSDIVKHAIDYSGSENAHGTVKLDPKLLKSILDFIGKALAASEETEATADDIRDVWSAG